MQASRFQAGFLDLLGLAVDAATGDHVVLRWEVGPQHHQPYGIVHGGVYCSAVETAASVAGALWYGDRGEVVGVTNSTDFFRPVREGSLTAEATPIHRGRSQQLWQVEITDADRRLVARGQVRLQNIPRDVSRTFTGPPDAGGEG